MIYEENVDYKNGESQYEDYDLTKETIVQAAYVHALHPDDKGNIFVEALPVPRSKKNVCIEYTKELAFYNEDAIKGMDISEKLINMKRIRELRLPLPFCFELEQEFFAALVMSYSARRLLEDVNVNVECCFQSKQMYQHSKLVGNPAESSVGYFSLIGVSGSGKSSTIYTLLSRYPQVIVHDIAENNRIVQVTYLVINCVACSNFSALYAAIGHALDIALGNINNLYSKEISKQRGLGKQSEKVQELIEKFKIGCIILDEIQEISFDGIRENSFNSLLTIVNNTKVALITVGTEEAYSKMYGSLRLCRRAGVPISSQQYCNFRKNGVIDPNSSDERYFRLLLAGIFKYQWFDKRVILTEDIVNAFYDVTKGIIDQIITVYILIHIEYFKNNKRPRIDGDFIRGVAKKRCGAVQKHLDNIGDFGIDSLADIANLKAEAEKEINKMISEAKAKEAADNIIQNEEKIASGMVKLTSVVKAFTSANTFFDFSEEEISVAFKKIIIRNKDTNSMDDLKVVCNMVKEQIERTRRKAKVVEKAGSNMNSNTLGANFTRELGLKFLGIEDKKDDSV